MQIVVASGNIFRRELSVYVLSEAGHHVVEVSDAAALLELAGRGTPQILIVDVLLARGDLSALRRALAEHGQSSVLWMVHSAADTPDLSGAPHDTSVGWPYNPDDLLRRIDDIIESLTAPDILVQPVRQRYAGDRG